MAHDTGLMIVNTSKQQVAQTVRAVLRAMDDGKISTMEAISLGFQAIMLAQSTMSIIQSLSPAVVREIIDVLEQGIFVMPGEDAPS